MIRGQRVLGSGFRSLEGGSPFSILTSFSHPSTRPLSLRKRGRGVSCKLNVRSFGAKSPKSKIWEPESPIFNVRLVWLCLVCG